MHQAGVPVKRIARIMGRHNCSMRELISRTGGIRPRARVVNGRHLGASLHNESSLPVVLIHPLTIPALLVTDAGNGRPCDRLSQK
jgi:hypothetical protein